MATASFASRRGVGMGASVAMRRGVGSAVNGASFTRNRNMAVRERAKLGPVSYSIVVGMLVLIVGLIYVNAGVRATSYDYDLARLDSEIKVMTAEKESLALENARLAAVAADEDKNEVAVNMVDARVSGAVSE